jgi:hypothetical protein
VALRAVLDHLGNRYGRHFSNHREFVRYAKEDNLGFDQCGAQMVGVMKTPNHHDKPIC